MDAEKEKKLKAKVKKLKEKKLKEKKLKKKDGGENAPLKKVVLDDDTFKVTYNFKVKYIRKLNKYSYKSYELPQNYIILQCIDENKEHVKCLIIGNDKEYQIILKNEDSQIILKNEENSTIMKSDKFMHSMTDGSDRYGQVFTKMIDMIYREQIDSRIYIFEHLAQFTKKHVNNVNRAVELKYRIDFNIKNNKIVGYNLQSYSSDKLNYLFVFYPHINCHNYIEPYAKHTALSFCVYDHTQQTVINSLKGSTVVGLRFVHGAQVLD